LTSISLKRHTALEQRLENALLEHHHKYHQVKELCNQIDELKTQLAREKTIQHVILWLALLLLCLEAVFIGG